MAARNTVTFRETAHKFILSLPKKWIITPSISGVVLALVVVYLGGDVWFVKTPPSTPLPSSSCALTCEWPKPNSDSVRLQVRQISSELGVQEMSDKLQSSAERVRKVLSAGDKCNAPELHDKMNLVDTTLWKIKEDVQKVYSGFNPGAKTALTDLKFMWDFAVQGKKEEAMQRIKIVCETTESLAEQLDLLKGRMDVKGSELDQALEALKSYQEKAKDNYESRMHKLRAEKQQYEEELNAAASLAREAEEKARSAAINAEKETEAWEELKSNNDAFGSDDQKKFKKRRAQFLKAQQTFEAEAEDSRRIMEQSQLKIRAIRKDNETANVAFKCISDTIAKMEEAVSKAPLPSVDVSLFEEGLKKACTELRDEIKSISSLGCPKGAGPSQVCDKAKKLFAKWQALSKVSLN